MVDVLSDFRLADEACWTIKENLRDLQSIVIIFEVTDVRSHSQNVDHDEVLAHGVVARFSSVWCNSKQNSVSPAIFD